MMKITLGLLVATILLASDVPVLAGDTTVDKTEKAADKVKDKADKAGDKVEKAADKVKSKANINQVIGNVFAELDIFKNLTFRSAPGIDLRLQLENENISRELPGTANSDPATRGSARNSPSSPGRIPCRAGS